MTTIMRQENRGRKHVERFRRRPPRRGRGRRGTDRLRTSSVWSSIQRRKKRGLHLATVHLWKGGQNTGSKKLVGTIPSAKASRGGGSRVWVYAGNW